VSSSVTGRADVPRYRLDLFRLDVEEDEVDEGEVLSCPECGMDFEVTTVNPVELKPVDEEEEYEEDDEEEETEDGDYS